MDVWVALGWIVMGKPKWTQTQGESLTVQAGSREVPSQLISW